MSLIRKYMCMCDYGCVFLCLRVSVYVFVCMQKFKHTKGYNDNCSNLIVIYTV